MAAAGVSDSSLMEAVRRRRSVRAFESTPIPEEVLTDILEAGRLAPSSGGVRSSYFGVIKDAETKRQLAEAAGSQSWIATAPVVLALCSRLSPDPLHRPADDFFFQVNRARFGDGLLKYLNEYPDRKAVRVFSDTAFPMIPGEHLALAAAAHGLGSCWIGHLDVPLAGQILGLPDEIVCLYLMPIGYPAEIPKPKDLRSLDECVFTDRWPAGVE